MRPCYYYRLKHLLSDKTSSRDQGKVNILTRQPVSGARNNNGGLRMSILQLDALAAAGASNFIHEKIFNLSDKFDVDICSTCHRMCAIERSGSKKKQQNKTKQKFPFLCVVKTYLTTSTCHMLQNILFNT